MLSQHSMWLLQSTTTMVPVIIHVYLHISGWCKICKVMANQYALPQSDQEYQAYKKE